MQVAAYMGVMTHISTQAHDARESARTNTGKFGTQEHTAPELSLDASATNGNGPFVFDRSYRNHEQVRPYMDDFLRVYDDVRRGSIAYDNDFVGRIPGLADSSEKDEKTGIYMLQTLRTLDIEEGKRQEFLASGGRQVTADDLQQGQVLRGTVVKSGFYMGGTGWEVREDIRLRVRSYPNGRRELEYVEKGKRLGVSLGDGDIYFRAD